MEITRILRQLLSDRNMTVAQLARATKIPRQTIQNWLAGQHPRSLHQIKTVADFFRVPIDYLCFGSRFPAADFRERMIEFENEIDAGVFEVVLRRVRRNRGSSR
jgi:transcriptional regulator with XRE-family HTH domain